MASITFLPSYRKITVDPGSTILDAIQKAQIQMNVVCGGQGKCGKCIVYIKNGLVDFDHEKFGKFFTADELDQGACLACQAVVRDDLHVMIPESSLIQQQKILMESLGIETPFQPSVWKYYVDSHPRHLKTRPLTSRGLYGGSRNRVAPWQRKCMLPWMSSGGCPVSSVTAGGGLPQPSHLYLAGTGLLILRRVTPERNSTGLP